MANRTRRQLRIRVVLIVFLAIVIAFAAVVGVPLIVAYLKKRSDLSRNSGSPDSHGPTMGKTGSRIITEDGRAFVYTNPFGGDWAADPREPFGVGGKAQEWSKRIGSEEWIWGSDIARGVNLGYVVLPVSFNCEADHRPHSAEDGLVRTPKLADASETHICQ